MSEIFFVSGIGTVIGKTLVSAILVEALKADYWKHIQAGGLDNTDTMVVKSLISNTVSKVHPESYSFLNALSPHAAAELEEIHIRLPEIRIPETNNTLIIEGAGGLMVPLNEEELVIDLIAGLKAKVVLVSRHYLGSINHTLLSAEALKRRSIPVKGIIFNGEPNAFSENIILKHTGFEYLGRIDAGMEISAEAVKQCARQFENLSN
jgi:dethiobiotin synthetase